MGVKGLKTYMLKSEPKAGWTVSLGKLAREYKNHTGLDPVLVVDGNSFVFKLHGGLNGTLGGQFIQYKEKIKSVVDHFRRINITLVVVFDGSIPDEKRRVWAKRQLEDLKGNKTFFEGLRKSKQAPFTTRRKCGRSQPPSLSRMTTKILGYETNVEVLNSLGEADIEIAEYCSNHRCWGVLSSDTDFIIMNRGMVFCVQDLNLVKMKTTCFDPTKLCRNLGISTLHLPILATLMGTDVLSSDYLAGFHKRLVKSSSRPNILELVPELADFIREKVDTHNYGRSVKALADELFPNSAKKRDLVI